jgi:hypothetical protein
MVHTPSSDTPDVWKRQKADLPSLIFTRLMPLNSGRLSSSVAFFLEESGGGCENVPAA